LNFSSRVVRIIRSVVTIDKRGAALVGLAAGWFFCILCGYYVIRPIREAMGVKSGNESLHWLFLGTFVAMLLAVPIYSACIAKLRRSLLIAVVYRFFIFNLLLFWWLFQSESPEVRVWVARAFFVWASVFGVYATTVFWSVLTDIFDSHDAKLSFGLIAAGGTVGAIAGSIAASLLAKQFATHTLLLVPTVLLEIGLWLAAGLQRCSQHPVVDNSALTLPIANASKSTLAAGEPTGGGVVDGIVSVVKSAYLRWICLFLFLGQLCATQLYFQQTSIVRDAISDDAGRTQLFANMNLGVQVLTLVLQLSVAGLMTYRIGLGIALAATPIAYLISFATLGVAPTLAVFVIADVVRRGLAYGVAVPAREVLFTVVSREDKYKSKGFIDTVIVRGGDAISSQLLAVARQIFSSPMVIQLGMIPVAALWVAISIRLASWQRKLAKPTTSDHS